MILTTSVVHFLYQRVYHRKTYVYDRLLYIVTAIVFTFQVINSTLSLFLVVNQAAVFGYILLAYQLILLLVVIRALGKLTYGQAGFVLLASLAAGAAIYLCMGPFILSMMGGVSSIL